MVKDEFPRLYRLSEESLEILRRLRYRHRLVKMRTMAKNWLHAISLSAGLSMKSKLLTKSGRAKFELLDLSPTLKDQRDEWLDLIDQLNHRITASTQSLSMRGRPIRASNCYELTVALDR